MREDPLPHSLDREAFRIQQIAALPRWYHPALHLGGEVFVCVAAAVLAFAFVRHPRATDWLALPASWVFGNIFEYTMHRWPMHHPTRMLKMFYRNHTLVHHKAYDDKTMALKDWRELALIMLGAPSILVIVLSASVMVFVLGKLFGWNFGLLFYGIEVLYILTYELSHLSYHLPAKHPMRRFKIVRWWKLHHVRHHDPERMTDWNFNIGLPICDWLFKTLWRPPKPDTK